MLPWPRLLEQKALVNLVMAEVNYLLILLEIINQWLRISAQDYLSKLALEYDYVG